MSPITKCGYRWPRTLVKPASQLSFVEQPSEQHEQCIERRYFDKIHYLALVCEDETLAIGCKSPSWRRPAKNFVTR